MSISKTNLAQELGISRTMLYRHAASGMPTTSYVEAKEWYDRNLHPGMTKKSRLFGNDGGVKRKQPGNHDIIRRTTDHVLTELIPQMWFEQVGWLGSVLKDNGVKVSAGQLLKVQGCLLMLYMGAVDEYYGEKTLFSIGEIMRVTPESEIYPSLIERLNDILEN
jgi:hypothetical protein